MGATNAPYVMTLANSIIGVSILAMPFCFKQCGVALASLILLMSSILTRLSCHYLLKSAIMSRRRSFEFLAFHSFGNTGKTVVELCIIFFMVGTCIAFFVVMGDLGPEIIGALINYNNLAALRPSVLIGLAVFVVLPLGMLRNVDSLSSICTASLVFYFCLVIKVFMESTGNLIVGDWMNDIHYWKPAGILQCLPIFSMALSCQSQLFEIFESVPGATLDRMNGIIKSAVNLCTALYISVGFFGYIAFYKQNLTGNILLSFSSSLSSDLVKIFFVLSVAVTFPLVIFPCRASMNSLLFRKAHVPHYELVSGGSGGAGSGGNHIPEARFKCITLFIITVPLTIGLLAPNIEIVLGLLGSTIGVVICILFPPLIFIQISSKATSERLCAQIVFAIGIFIMIMGTYANLYLAGNSADVRKEISIEKSENLIPVASIVNNKVDALNSLQVPPKESNGDKALPANDDKKIILTDAKDSKPETAVESNLNGEVDQRKEPPIPIAPDLPNIPPPKESEDKKIPRPQPINVVNDPANDKPNDAINVKIDPSKESKKHRIDAEPANDPSKEKTMKVDNAVIDKPVNEGDRVVAEVAKKEVIAFDNKKPPSTYENISALIKDSIPLPVAVNQSIISSGKNSVRGKDENVAEIQPRDILQKEPSLEREKRDLEYVTGHGQFIAAAGPAETPDNKAVSNRLNGADGGDDKLHSGSFVKSVAQSDRDESCTKKYRSQVRSSANDAAANVSKQLLEKAKDTTKDAPSDEPDPKLARVQKSKSSEDAANGLATIPDDVLVPSKLSVPNIIDSGKNDVISSIDNRIGPVDIKPMKRELKSVDDAESSKT